MYDNPILPHVMLAFDIRPVMPLLDLYHINYIAQTRYLREIGHNPDHAFLLKQGSEGDQKIRVHRENVIDDLICRAINSFEHTWVHRNLRNITHDEQRAFESCHLAWSALYRCIIFQPEHAGLFAHYQRINDSIFLAVPKY